MHIAQPFSIVGAGTAMPEQRITSAELEVKLGLPAGWSEKYSGVRERYYAAPGTTNSQLAARALQQALDHAGLQPQDLDVVVAASATYDYPLPNNACMIMHELAPKVGNISCIDVDATCLSFLTGIDYAGRMVASGDARYVAIVSSEIASRGLNPDHKESATLFGDGAAAIILGPDPTGTRGLVKYSLKTFPAYAHYTMIEGGGNARPFQDYPYDQKLHSFHMEGKKLLKQGKNILIDFIPAFFEPTGISLPQVDAVLPHQASKTALYLFEKVFPIAPGRLHSNLLTRGNCIASSIPTLLAQGLREGKLTEGQTCFMVGTAAGLSIGGALVQL